MSMMCGILENATAEKMCSPCCGAQQAQQLAQRTRSPGRRSFSRNATASNAVIVLIHNRMPVMLYFSVPMVQLLGRDK